VTERGEVAVGHLGDDAGQQLPDELGGEEVDGQEAVAHVGALLRRRGSMVG
jgi:hypothetical protein